MSLLWSIVKRNLHTRARKSKNRIGWCPKARNAEWVVTRGSKLKEMSLSAWTEKNWSSKLASTLSNFPFSRDVNKENIFHSHMITLTVHFSFTILWFKFLILMTMKKKEIQYESFCMNIEIHIWTSFNRNKKNTGCSTIHLFNIYFLDMLCPRCWGSSCEHGRQFLLS